MIERAEERFDLEAAAADRRHGWKRPAVAMWSYWAGWSTTKGSNRTCRCGIRRSATTERYPAATSNGSEQADEYRCSAGKCSAESKDARSRTRVPTSPRLAPLICRASQSGLRELPDEGALLPEHPEAGRSLAVSMNRHAMSLATLPRPMLYKQSRKDRKEGGDAVRTPQAHPEACSPAPAWAERCAHDEFLLAAIAQNLRRMAKRLFLNRTRSDRYGNVNCRRAGSP